MQVRAHNFSKILWDLYVLSCTLFFPGLLGAYYTALHSVQLYGPTNFSPAINHVAKFAAAYQANHCSNAA